MNLRSAFFASACLVIAIGSYLLGRPQPQPAVAPPPPAPAVTNAATNVPVAVMATNR